MVAFALGGAGILSSTALADPSVAAVTHPVQIHPITPVADRGIILPLRTQGAQIVDRTGRPVRIDAVSWSGAESTDFVVGGLQAQPLSSIVGQIRDMGFNAVRLQWSNQLFESDPIVPSYAVSANPEFEGWHAMQVFDRVVYALTGQGIMVILDNHNSNAEWCCGGGDGNMLWYNAEYPESSWINDWKAMALRYSDDPLVVGADLRNEPRSPATWGGPAGTDWQAAAERGGDAVLSVNPRLLVLVEGVSYAGDLSGVQSLPVQLAVPDRVVYEAHDYSWYESGFSGYDEWVQRIYPKWGYLVSGPDPQPVLVGEFGTCDTAPACVSSTSPSDSGYWFQYLTAFLAQHQQVGWSYWAVNGTESTGNGRTWGAPETYGILNPRWDAPASPELLQRLQQIQGQPFF
ncbi:MAG TPA: glycoside hydrolase family 5 protein [Candidatus Dormibacteraeota bacterium]|nr:glycoside hydrolase family 5 protein [Candidatus Dormibacteraeota bacterium]